MKDILHELYILNKHNLTPPAELICGEKYFAVLNEQGNLGVCANLESHISLNKEILQHPDFSNYHHRVAVNAWINASVNYKNTYKEEIDIFDKIDFKAYKSIVMVGYFESLVNRFQENAIPLTIFDLNKVNHQITPIEEQSAAIANADIIITTSTTLANNTLSQIAAWKNNRCKLIMLGPSTPLSTEFASLINITYLFGATFQSMPQNVIALIEAGAGTKRFLPYMKKVYLALNI